MFRLRLCEGDSAANLTLQPAGGRRRAAYRLSMVRTVMTNERPPSRWLVTTDWLAERPGAPTTVVVDGSFYLPAMKRDAAAEYLAGHIPGAVRFDIDAIADHSNPLPHMLPNADAVRAPRSGELGIADTDTIVVYDGAGMFSARRGCGGRFASSAPRTCSSSTAGCRNGRRKAARSKPARSSGRRARSRRAQPANVAGVARRVRAPCRQIRAGGRCATGRPFPWGGARAARRACAPATCRARFNVPSSA